MSYTSDKPCLVVTARGTRLFGPVTSLDSATESGMSVDRTDLLIIGSSDAKRVIVPVADCEIWASINECPMDAVNLC